MIHEMQDIIHEMGGAQPCEGVFISQPRGYPTMGIYYSWDSNDHGFLQGMTTGLPATGKA
jgi:hypothetical protein